MPRKIKVVCHRVAVIVMPLQHQAMHFFQIFQRFPAKLLFEVILIDVDIPLVFYFLCNRRMQKPGSNSSFAVVMDKINFTGSYLQDKLRGAAT